MVGQTAGLLATFGCLFGALRPQVDSIDLDHAESGRRFVQAKKVKDDKLDPLEKSFPKQNVPR